MNKYYSDPQSDIYLGDALSVIPELKPQSVDMIMTSPPY
jgi:DNA modification methylase